MNKIVIVAVAYDRKASLARLVGSLLAASYCQPADLIISIDNSGTNVVKTYAETVNWPFGTKIIRTFEQKQGLKKHILKCGTYMAQYGYDAMIVLEDDLFVSPDFFNFAVQAVEKYKGDMRIAGISLYSHTWNINADRPFCPLQNNYDVYYMQMAQSWGQIWMSAQWCRFEEWIAAEGYLAVDARTVPDNILCWPESSWLKWHMQYCVANDLYFIYPYVSLTTNFADAGTHYAFSTNKMQVPVRTTCGKRYLFPETMEDAVCYDVFHENTRLAAFLKMGADELCVDLYGRKHGLHERRYLLTMRTLPYDVVGSFGLQMRPWEQNIIHRIPGEDIYLYDTARPAAKPRRRAAGSVANWRYDTRGQKILKNNLIAVVLHELSEHFRRR